MGRLSRRNSVVMALFTVALMQTVACSSGDGGEKRTRTSTKKTTETGKTTQEEQKSCTPTSSTTPKTSTTSTSSTTGAGAAEDDDTTPITAGLLLADVPYSTVSTVIAGKCATSGCHAAGKTAPDLSTEALAKASAAEISERVLSTASPMPPKTVALSGKLSVSEQDNIVAWAKGVVAASEAAPEPTTTSSTCTNGTSDTTTTGTKDDVGDDSLVIAAAFKEIMEPAALKTCQSQGKLYDWKYSQCDTALYSASVTCDKDLVLKNYPNETTVATAVTKWETEKWRYNQCGTENGT